MLECLKIELQETLSSSSMICSQKNGASLPVISIGKETRQGLPRCISWKSSHLLLIFKAFCSTSNKMSTPLLSLWTKCTSTSRAQGINAKPALTALCIVCAKHDRGTDTCAFLKCLVCSSSGVRRRDFDRSKFQRSSGSLTGSFLSKSRIMPILCPISIRQR